MYCYKSSHCLTLPDFRTQHLSHHNAPSLSLNSASRFLEALTKIEPSITVPGSCYPVLRVFASWPADAKLERTLTAEPPLKKQKTDQAKDDEDEDVNAYDSDVHPIAALHMLNFENIGKSFAKLWFKNNTEQWQVEFAKQPSAYQEQV
jgi:hypothetical protein